MVSAEPYANLHLISQITMPTPHQSLFYRPDIFPSAQPTASKHLEAQRQQNIHFVEAQNFYEEDVIIVMSLVLRMLSVFCISVFFHKSPGVKCIPHY